MQPMRKIPNELVLISPVSRATERERAEKGMIAIFNYIQYCCTRKEKVCVACS